MLNRWSIIGGLTTNMTSNLLRCKEETHLDSCEITCKQQYANEKSFNIRKYKNDTELSVD